MRALAVAILVSMTCGAPKGTRPLQPSPLTWDMDQERAMKVLAKHAPRSGDRHAYIAGQDGHTVEPEVLWDVPHGRAEARWQWSTQAEAFRLDEVSFTRTLTWREAAAELAALERRFGAPTKMTSDGYGKSRVWVRDGVWLTAFVAKVADPATERVGVSVAFRRDDRPAP